MSIGTPDFQKGVVSAQKLVGTITPPAQALTVGVPPNAETLIVTCDDTQANISISCQGVQTATVYVGRRAGRRAGFNNSVTWFFDVSNAVDTQVTISYAPQPPHPVSIYIDGAVHLVANIGDVTNTQDLPYSIPCPPGPASADRPPNELSSQGVQLTGNGNVLAAPGVGLRYRVFHAQLVMASTGINGVMTAAGAGNPFLAAPTGGVGQMDYGPSGLPLPANTAIGVFLSAAGTAYGIVVFTQEFV